jgi:hypothetical protein
MTITAAGLYVPPIGFRPALLQDPDLGRVYVPKGLRDLVSYPGRPCRPRYGPGEVGVVIGTHHRPEYDEDRHGNLFIRRMRLLWASITHNERVDAGASQQARQVFGGGSSPGAPSATAYPKAIAVASATLTKSKGDLSLGSTTAGSTANEFTTIGLSRALADTPVAGDYTVPDSLGGQFQQVLRRQFTATGTGTAYGAGLFDSTTPSGSTLYLEDNFSTSASLVANDTLTVTITINN